MKYLILCFFTSFTPFAFAADSQYKGQQHRNIKALSPQEIDSLKKGKGMGFAKAAELNHFPGPLHVLEVAKQLNLKPKQLEATKNLFSKMNQKAKTLGEELISHELELETHFRKNLINQNNLKSILDKIAKTKASLRFVHLNAHIKMKEILSAKQVRKYDHLRGYEGNRNGRSEHGHSRHRH